MKFKIFKINQIRQRVIDILRSESSRNISKIPILFLDWPLWKSDFAFGAFKRNPPGMTCLKIYEQFEYYNWNNYYFCWKDKGKHWNPLWSDSGRIPGMRCTQIYDATYSYWWRDNFLCFPQNTPYRLVACYSLDKTASFDLETKTGKPNARTEFQEFLLVLRTLSERVSYGQTKIALSIGARVV